MGIQIKKYDAEKSITLDNRYKFNCIQCGKCCKNYKIKDPRAKQEIYGFYLFTSQPKENRISEFNQILIIN